ncbi:hypothetical protein V8C34DRAFT_320712 [Trichoderma compactum]
MEPLGLLLLCKKVKNAAAETEQLRQLLANFQNVLTSFEKMRSSPNNAKLKHTHQLNDAIRETQSLLQKLVDDLSPSSEKAHRILRKIKGSSIKWPFDKNDILKRINSLEQCMQVIGETLQVDQTNLILLDIDYRAILGKLPVASDAYFDSFDESSKARRLPDTRVDLLQDVSNWAKNPDSHAVSWLNGMAGTGKSTISRTISEMLANENRLGAGFFFKSGEADRGGLTKFLTTIAADLFKQLILDPLSSIPRDSAMANPIIVVIDALDECDRLKFFLTSRPELPFCLGFKKIEGTYRGLILHEVPTAIIESDILKYLECERLNIRNEYNLTRPDDSNFQKVGLTITPSRFLSKWLFHCTFFASTTCRFIADCKHSDPQRQLQRVLQYQTQTKGTRSRLDATYLPILAQQLGGLSNSEKADVAEEFRAIVGTIIILANPLSITALSRMLDISKETISNRLEMLHSVLDMPSSLAMPVRMWHLSFRDFLLNPDERDATSLWVEERQAHVKMADHCLRLLDNLKPDICNLKSPCASAADIPQETISHHPSPEVQCSCLYWVSHVRHSEIKLVDGGPASEFLLRHFLHWLVALSLMDRTREAIGFFRMLQALVESESGIKTLAFLKDAEQFARTHASTIESCPLQTYFSALVFTPSDSIARIQFDDCIPSWILFPPLVDHGLNPFRILLTGHSYIVASACFSPGSALIASGSEDSTNELLGHETCVAATTFSQDSTLVASASYDGVIHIWNTNRGVCQSIMHQKEDRRPWLMMFSPDSTRLIVVYRDGALQYWRVDTETCERRIHLGIKGLHLKCAALLRDCKYFPCTTTLNKTLLWRIDTERCVHTFNPRIDQFSYDASFIGASIGGKRRISIWQIGTGQLMHNMHHRSNYCCGYGVHLGRWIVWGKQRLLDLPKRYETQKSAAGDCAIVLGYELDRVIILMTSKDGPDFEHAAAVPVLTEK